MLYPSIDEMLEKVDSKYSLVVAAAKRARKLRDGSRSVLEQPHSNKYVGIALEELYHDIILFESNPNMDMED